MIDIQKLADLARLSVPKDEQDLVVKDLETIIGFVDQVQSRNVSEAVLVFDKVNIVREDEVVPLRSAYNLVDAAPSHQDVFVKVPKIIE